MLSLQAYSPSGFYSISFSTDIRTQAHQQLGEALLPISPIFTAPFIIPPMAMLGAKSCLREARYHVSGICSKDSEPRQVFYPTVHEYSKRQGTSHSAYLFPSITRMLCGRRNCFWPIPRYQLHCWQSCSMVTLISYY